MRIKELILRDFGPFKYYKVPFVDEEHACVLLTGKNNEGKSTIISALKLLDAATRVIRKKKQEFRVNSDICWRLLQQDVQDLLVGRMIHDYQDVVGEIEGRFRDGFSITVYIDGAQSVIYADYDGVVPRDLNEIFGFVPALGPLTEKEEIISKESYLRACLGTSLAPRHLRNHLHQLLTPPEYALVKEIIDGSWDGVTLLDCAVNYRDNRIDCFYKEGRMEREIAWAGQGLQVWFQIVTHLVRLRSRAILVLDEPEVNLHPEKQNDLIRVIREYYGGSVIIATHSVELMNNVSVSHIIHVQKRKNRPEIKSTQDRHYLNLVRSEVGSNFNLIASQFEEFDLIIFTEDASDFSIIRGFAERFAIARKAFNIPIHGFAEHGKTPSYKKAYELLIGKRIDYTLVLDRDYYPDEHLRKIADSLGSQGIRTVFTPGKEIENLFLCPDVVDDLLRDEQGTVLSDSWESIFESLRMECYSSFLALHKKFLDPQLDTKTVTKEYTPGFERQWKDRKTRHRLIDGKMALGALRDRKTIK